jgi:TPR repeat protein
MLKNVFNFPNKKEAAHYFKMAAEAGNSLGMVDF